MTGLVVLPTTFVEGVPIPQGSITRNRQGHAYADNAKRLYPWRRAIAGAVGFALPEPFPEAVDLRLSFAFPRPAKHYGRRKGQPYLRDDAPRYPTARYSTGDLDKLVRAVLDALTMGGVLVDDAQVVGIVTEKRWADGDLRPGVLFEVTRTA